MKKVSARTYLLVLAALAVLCAAGAGYLGYEWRATSTELASTTAALASAKADAQSLSEALDAEKTRNDSFAAQIQSIGGTVGKLDKLSQIDPELLEKYSKVFFLSENYIPAKLTQIPADLVAKPKDEYFEARALPYLENLLNAAADDGIDLTVASAYRAFEEQKNLKNAYTVAYGSGANSFSADQGYSEHQLGTAVDFTGSEVGGGLVTSFDETKAYAWLQKNAYKYGFILSYPKGNAYYIYEPWHWRFVSRDLAQDLHADGKNFYDLDQRDIDTYLINFFD